MWGYSCGAAVGGSTATCAKSNHCDRLAPAGDYGSHGTGPAGQPHQQSQLGPRESVPTSLVMVGQLGGGLGIVTQRTVTASPDHSNAQQTTWPIFEPAQRARRRRRGRACSHSPRRWRRSNHATDLDGGQPAGGHVPDAVGHASVHPGSHGPVRNGGGDHGAGGATPGTAYPGVTYNAEVPVLLGEIDPVQNKAVNKAVNTADFTEKRQSPR